MQTKKCKDCQRVKPWILVTPTEDKQYRYYINDKGSRWGKGKCPDCRKAVYKADKAWGKRQEKKCRDCGKKLPLTRYFSCQVCTPATIADNYRVDDNYAYC